jgi:hypothetical protein
MIALKSSSVTRIKSSRFHLCWAGQGADYFKRLLTAQDTGHWGEKLSSTSPVYRPRRELQKAAPRNFDAFFARRQKKTVEIPAVPGRERASRFCNSRLQQGDPSFVCRNQAAETKEGNIMTNPNNTLTQTQRPTRQGRVWFRRAVRATCNPAWHAQQAMLQRYNQARRRRLSPTEARWIERLHTAGQTLKQIGASLRINRAIITRELRVHGIVLTPHPSISMSRMSLLDAEVEQIQTMLKQGRNMAYISEEICVCEDVIRRELRAKGIRTRPERRRRAVKKSIGGWWGTLGDEPDAYRKVEDWRRLRWWGGAARFHPIISNRRCEELRLDEVERIRV